MTLSAAAAMLPALASTAAASVEICSILACGNHNEDAARDVAAARPVPERPATRRGPALLSLVAAVLPIAAASAGSGVCDIFICGGNHSEGAAMDRCP